MTEIEVLKHILSQRGCNNVTHGECPMTDGECSDGCNAKTESGYCPLWCDFDDTSRAKIEAKLKELEGSVEEKTMTKAEAIRSMLDGEEIFFTGDLRKNVAIRKYVDGFFYQSLNGQTHFFDVNDMQGHGWAIYTPQKEKVKMWQWVIRHGNNKPVLTRDFHKCESEVPLSGTETLIVQRADWTEIEVEI